MTFCSSRYLLCAAASHCPIVLLSTVYQPWLCFPSPSRMFQLDMSATTDPGGMVHGRRGNLPSALSKPSLLNTATRMPNTNFWSISGGTGVSRDRHTCQEDRLMRLVSRSMLKVAGKFFHTTPCYLHALPIQGTKSAGHAVTLVVVCRWCPCSSSSGLLWLIPGPACPCTPTRGPRYQQPRSSSTKAVGSCCQCLAG